MIFKSKKKSYMNNIDYSEFLFYKNNYLFDEKSRDRCKEYPPFNFDFDSIILIGRLDSKNFPEIYIYIRSVDQLRSGCLMLVQT